MPSSRQLHGAKAAPAKVHRAQLSIQERIAETTLSGNEAIRKTRRASQWGGKWTPTAAADRAEGNPRDHQNPA